MSQQAHTSGHSRRLVVPMLARSPDEVHRAATPLELFFDLVFVVAIAQAGSALHHAIVGDHIASAVISFGMVFFAIWWAWMNFTWFASAYDTDDVAYRLVALFQIAGSLILAAGIPQAFGEHDFRVTTLGYVVMRLGLVAQWLRAAASDRARTVCARRYALGVSACQVGWVALLRVSGGAALLGFVALVVAELLVPIWAERGGRTTWHPSHIAERYGLFTIIVLGESILAASTAIQAVTQATGFTTNLLPVIVGGLLVVFSMWWFYFDFPTHDMLASLRTAFLWGYGHFLVFAAAAATGAGLAVVTDHVTGHSSISSFAAGAAVAVPVAIYLFVLWLLHRGPHAHEPLQKFLIPTVALLVLITPATSQPVLLSGLLLASLLAIKLASRAISRV